MLQRAAGADMCRPSRARQGRAGKDRAAQHAHLTAMRLPLESLVRRSCSGGTVSRQPCGLYCTTPTGLP